MTMLLTGRIAVITGASKGIGRVMAQMFAHEGAKVVCAARSDALGSNIGAPRLRGRLSQILSSRVVLAVTQDYPFDAAASGRGCTLLPSTRLTGGLRIT